MPTIHIHLSEPRDVGDVVAHLLTTYDGVEVIIDQDDDELAGDPADQPQPNHNAESLAIATRVATIDETGRLHPVVQSVIDADRATGRTERASRMAETVARQAWRLDMARQRKMAIEADYDRLISFLCHTCGAVPGKPCRSTGTNKPYGRTYVHLPREQALAGRPDRVTAWPTAIRVDLDEV